MLTAVTRARRRRDEDGVVAANLAIVLSFALFAVIMLTRTTIAVEQIDDRVKVIVGEVEPINEDLTNVPKLDETDRIAAEILASAQPLSGQAAEIITTAQSIDSTVSEIQSNAGSINGTVKSINGKFTNLQPVVRSINDGVAAINGRVDRIIQIVAGIENDLSNILAEVGAPAGPGSTVSPDKRITGHANSIDCTANTGGGACTR